MHNRLAVMTIGVLLVAASCSSISVRADFDSDADFGLYRTFGFATPRADRNAARRSEGARTRELIVSAVERELTAKGYRKAIDDRPDFLVAVHIAAENRIDVDVYDYRTGWRGRWRGRDVRVERYKEGTLVIDIVDRRMRDLVWRGTAKGAIRGPGDVGEHIDESVRKTIERFPPEID